MEDCDTPVLGALAIRLAALGVAFWRMGLLITGRAAVGGLVDCLSDVGDRAGLSDDGDDTDDGEDIVTGEDDVSCGDGLPEDKDVGGLSDLESGLTDITES